MSFLSFLSPAITAASDVAGGYEQGKERVAKEQIAQAVLAQKQKRQDTMDALAARNVNSEINTRENPTDKSIHIDQDGNAWRMEGGALVPVTTGQPNSATAPAPTAAGAGSGDINLGINTSGPTKSADQGPAVAPPSQGKQGSTAAPQSAPQGTAPKATPKFGPKKEASTIPGTPEWRAAKIAEAKISNEYGYHPPQSQFSFGTTIGPDGKPVVLRQNTKTGEVTPTDAAKPAAGGNSAGQAQMAASKANMESAMKVMDAYEAKLKKDPSLFGALAATEGSLASSPAGITAQHSWDVPISLAANLAASNLQKTNPELAKYLTAKKFMAEAILNTHKRPNQTQYEIEQEIGGVGANPSAMQIDMVASRRQRMYNELFGGGEAATVKTGGASGDVNLGAKPKLSQADYDAGLLKHTDAEIAKHYDLTGVKRK